MRTMISSFAIAAALGLATPALAAKPKTDPVAEADAFVAQVEKELGDYSILNARAQWINANFITEDTDAIAAEFGARGTELGVKYAKGAARFDDVKGLSFDTRRKLDFLKQGLVLPAPDEPGAADELNQIATRLQSAYGKGKGTLNGKPINGSDIEEAMGTNRDPDDLKEMWVSWHDNVGAPMKDDYARLVEIANEGANALGYKDLGGMWRSGYDMPPEEFSAMMDKLWLQVKPLYDQLHCYTRAKLNQKYGAKVQPATGPIRADLLGNMWAQEWGNIYDIVAPKGAGDIGYDLTDLLVTKGYDPLKMVKTGEGFYSSLGLAPLPETFWERSLITKPSDR
ncbi:MAG: M2 family metallopeptidase, partial [Sphingomonadaceae bacterium]